MATASTQSHKATMWLIQAQHLANAMIARLQPLCEPGKCVVAGSVRRKTEKVNDIEIVCIPKWGHFTKPGELFPQDGNLVIHHFETSSDIKILKGGPRYHQIIFSHTQIDVFMTTPQQWGRMLAVRTGPADYSIKLASRWNRLGYKGYKGELVSLDGQRRKPKFPTEKSFFEFLGWNYPQPEERGQ